MDLAASEVEKPASKIFPLPAESCLLFSAVSDRDNFPFFEGFRLDIMISKNAQGGLPGWDGNPELLPPCAKERMVLSNRESGFLTLRRSRGDAPRSSAGKTEKLRLFWDFQTVPKESRYQKTKGRAAKDRMEKGRTGDPGITDRKALKSSREISAPKTAVDSEKRIRCP